MEMHTHHSIFERRPITKSKAPAVKWFKEWVPQDVVATGGKCFVLKWVTESTLKVLKEKTKEPEAVAPEPEPTTEVLFLCSYESCGKTFIDAGALRKHSHIHGERQYICHYENCGKKFLDSSKLKRHFLIHTGERDFVCPHEGCGKAFSLDFNLRSHMKTHSQENYHICPYPECGKRYAHEYKLKNHIMSQHEKNIVDLPKYVPPPEKLVRAPEKPVKAPEKQVRASERPVKSSEKPAKASKASAATYGAASVERPYSCPYEGCEKAYIHEYKLNLHLRREHPGHFPDENAKNAQSNADNEMDEGSDQDAYAGKRGSSKVQKQSRPKPNIKLPPSKVAKLKGSSAAPSTSMNMNIVKKPWPVKVDTYEEEDSEETEEEDRDNVYGREDNVYGREDDDDELTEYED